ncbi:hypothetical protein AOLI_G00003320 [Acnodon oligacanthus]
MPNFVWTLCKYRTNGRMVEVIKDGQRRKERVDPHLCPPVRRSGQLALHAWEGECQKWVTCEHKTEG